MAKKNRTEQAIARRLSLPKKRPSERIDLSERQARRLTKKLSLDIQILEGEAELAKAAARRQITSCCRDLVPVAIGFARRGRPRLLAVIAKILGDKNLVVNWKK